MTDDMKEKTKNIGVLKTTWLILRILTLIVMAYWVYYRMTIYK